MVGRIHLPLRSVLAVAVLAVALGVGLHVATAAAQAVIPQWRIAQESGVSVCEKMGTGTGLALRYQCF